MSAGELVVSIIGDMKELSRVFSQVQTEVGKVGKQFETMGKSLSSAGTSMAAGITVPILAIAGTGALLVNWANDVGKSQGQVKASLGLTAEEANKLTDAAMNVWKNGFGDSIDAVNQVIVSVRQNMGDLAGQELESVASGAITISELFGDDVNEVTAAAGVLMRNFGIDGQHALDIITTGYQQGGDFSKELLDTLREYAPQFQAMGVSADEFLAILISGAEAGAWNLDKVADAVKEFNIRAQDGSDLTISGFAAIGLSADEMSQKIAAGGDSAKEAFIATVAGLMAIEDPVKRNIAGVALFGTQWEDVKAQVIDATASGIQNVQDVAGATDKAAKDVADSNPMLALTEAARDLQADLLPIIQGQIIPLITQDLLPILTGTLIPFIENVALPAISAFVEGFAALPEPVQLGAIAFTAFITALGPILMLVGAVVSSIGTLATAVGTGGVLATAFASAKLAITGFLTILSGLALPIAAIIAVVAALALAWKNNWGDIQGKAKAVWDWLQSEMNKLVNRLEYYYHALVMAISAADLEDKWDRIKNRLEYYYHALVMGASGLYNDLKKYWDELSTALEPAKESLSSAWDSIKTIWETFKTSFLDSMSTLYENVKKALEPLWDTLDELWQQLKEDVIPVVLDFLGSFSGSAMDDAQGDIDSLTGIINFLSEKLSEFLDWVARHPEITEFVATVAAMAVAIPVALGLLAAGIVLFVAKVVSLFIELVKAAYDLYTDWKAHFENLKTTVTQAIDYIIAKVRGWYTENVNKFNLIKSAALDLLNNWRTHWDNIKTTLTQAVSDIVTRLQGWYNDTQARFTQVKTAALALLIDWRTHWENFKSTLTQAAAYIMTKLQGWYTDTQNKFNLVKAAALDILNNWRTHWENFKTALNLAVANIIAKLQSWYTDVQNRFNQVKAAALAFYNNWKARWDSIWKTLSDAKDYIINTAQMLYNDLLNRYNRIKAELSNLLTEWKARWNEIYTSVKTKATEIVNEVYGIVTKLKNKATEFYNAGKNLVQNLIDGINDKISSLRKKIDELTSMIADYLPMNSPSLKGALSKLPKWDDVVSSPVAKSLSSTVSAAKSAGSSIVSSIASGISSAAKTAYNAASSALKKVKSLLPHSPAEEGPFSEIPNWDSIFVDPMKESIARTAELAKPLSQALSSVRSPIDSLSGGLGQVAAVTNNSFAGDTITIGPNTLANSVDVRMLIEELNKYTANKRRARGLYS